MAGGFRARSGADAALARGWLGQSERSTFERGTRAKVATKRLDRNKIGSENRGPLSADRKGFGGQEAAHPNPTEKATVLEGEMMLSRDAKARD